MQVFIIFMFFSCSEQILACSSGEDETLKTIKNLRQQIRYDFKKLMTDHWEHTRQLNQINQRFINGTENIKEKIEELNRAIHTGTQHIRDITKTMERSQLIILQQVYGLDKKISGIHTEVVDKVESRLFSQLDMTEFLDQFNKYLDFARQIDRLYQKFKLYLHYPDQLNKWNVKGLVEVCFGVQSDQRNVELLLNDMEVTLTSPRGMFSLISKDIVEKYVLAMRRTSSLEFLLNIFLYFVANEIKVMMMMSGTSIMSKAMYYEELDLQFETFRSNSSKRLLVMLDMVKLSAARCSGRYWVYDTVKHRAAYEYVAFIDFMKGFFYRDTDCKFAGLDLTNGVRADRKLCQVKNNKICEGHLFCESPKVIAASPVTICYSHADALTNYEYVVFSYESKKQCDGSKISYKNNSKCVNCLCHCQLNNKKGGLFISLDEMTSDTKANRVIVGLRFNKRNDAIVLDILTTQYDDKMSVRESTSQWINNQAHKKYRFSYPYKRAIHIGEIRTSSRSVITGVRFAEARDGVELHVRINDLIRCCKNRTLISKTGTWITPDRSTEEIIDIRGPRDSPAAGDRKQPVHIQSFGHRRVDIITTTFPEDGAQSVIPFFDSRPVVCGMLTPLRGIGLVYKTAGPQYGGFIAPFIVLADYSSNMEGRNFISERSDAAGMNSVQNITMFFIIIIYWFS